jgi:hypothetical protein
MPGGNGGRGGDRDLLIGLAVAGTAAGLWALGACAVLLRDCVVVDCTRVRRAVARERALRRVPRPPEIDASPPSLAWVPTAKAGVAGTPFCTIVAVELGRPPTPRAVGGTRDEGDDDGDAGGGGQGPAAGRRMPGAADGGRTVIAARAIGGVQ